MNGASNPSNGRATTALAGLGVLAAWAVVAVRWSALPVRIPVHFDLQGHVDRYGSRSTLLLLPALATVLFAFLAGLQRYPHLYNLPVEKGSAQRAECERLGTQMLRRLTLVLCWLFALQEAALAFALPPSLLILVVLFMMGVLMAVVVSALVRMQRLTP